MNETMNIILGRECRIFRHDRAEYLLIQPVDDHDASLLEQEVDIIGEWTKKPFTLVSFKIHDWNKELTPWPAPPVFGKTPFGAGAQQTLEFVINGLLPCLQSQGIDASHKILGGYSLAGLFALWASYQTSVFDSVVAASPSVWYPDWIDYATGFKPFATSVYLSLGDKEEKTKNPLMSQVGNAIRKQHFQLDSQGVNTILEWNPGNHFVDSEKRMAKGYTWIINNQTKGL